MKEIFFISLLSSLIFAWIGYLLAKVDFLKLQNKVLKGINYKQDELIKELKNYNAILNKIIKNTNNH